MGGGGGEGGFDVCHLGCKEEGGRRWERGSEVVRLSALGRFIHVYIKWFRVVR